MQRETNSPTRISSWGLVILAGITTLTVAAAVCPTMHESNSACCVTQEVSCKNQCTKIECSSTRGAKDCTGPNTGATRCSTAAATVTETTKDFDQLPDSGNCTTCGVSEVLVTITAPDCQNVTFAADPTCTP